MDKKVNIQFFIKEISTIEFSVKNSPNLKIKENNDAVFEVSPSTAIDTKSSTINFIIQIGIYSDNTKKESLCRLVSSIKYGIKNMEVLIDENDNNRIRIPNQFMQTLLSLSLSTSRGILAVKTEGTNLMNTYLPVLNPTNFKPAEHLAERVNS